MYKSRIYKRSSASEEASSKIVMTTSGSRVITNHRSGSLEICAAIVPSIVILRYAMTG
jgi:hypothetical protein